MNNTRQPLIALLAIGAALAMPMAFAQNEPTEGVQDAATQAQPTTEPAATDPRTWADVDSDKDGAISKEESAQLASLAQVFDAADADGNGLLTVDEYKAYVAKADSADDGSGGTD